MQGYGRGVFRVGFVLVMQIERHAMLEMITLVLFVWRLLTGIFVRMRAF